MPWITRSQPDGLRLFRTVLVASIIAVVFCGTCFLALWAWADYEPVLGRELTVAFGMMVGILTLGTLLHYPWGPTWCRANGAKYPFE